MRTSALFDAKKTLDFSKFMVCPHRQGGGRDGADILRKRGRGYFSSFCADVFYERPLIEKQILRFQSIKQEVEKFWLQ